MTTDPNDPDDTVDNPWDETTPPPKSKKKTTKKAKDPEDDCKVTSINDYVDQKSNPWGKGNRPFKDQNGLNDFIHQFTQGSSKSNGSHSSSPFQSHGNGNGPTAPHVSGKSFIILGLIALGIWLSSGIFRVQETDLAVVTRLGKLHSIVGPGLQYCLPYPIDAVTIKNVSANNVMNSTDRLAITRAAGDKNDQTLVLTGDENIIHISYTVTWKIKDLPQYLFNMCNPDSTILAATESIIREVIGQTHALAALTEERKDISHKATALLQKALDQYQVGVSVMQVQLQKVEPPVEVIEAFNDMQASLTDGDGLRIKAEAYKSEIVPKARGDAAKAIQEAEGYAQQVVAKAQGEADRFKFVYTEYRKNPEVAKKRLYVEAMEQILSKAQKTIIDAKAAPGIVPYVNLQHADALKK